MRRCGTGSDSEHVGDPATPLAWAESLHEQLTGSSLVIAPGQGHIASSHNKCADAATLNFAPARHASGHCHFQLSS